MICSIILAGGSGTRLWPVSDSKTPKQFLNLFSDNSMIVETSKRIETVIPLENQYVVTGKVYENLADQQFDGGMKILVEPFAKNTAPCILWTSLKIKKEYGGDAIVAVLPSDHIIKENETFLKAFKKAIDTSAQGKIVTFGILPSRPETGYGYIEITDSNYQLNQTVHKIVAFKEKPALKLAEEYVASGNYLWNSGMFVFCVDTIIKEFEKHCPDVYGCFCNVDPDDTELVMQAFYQTPSISIDYAVMERTDLGCCIPSSFGWSDVGSFQSLHDVHEKDANGNVCVGNVIAQDTKGCYINGKKRIICIGLDDLVVVEGEDTILVSKKDVSSAIGEIAKKIREE